MEQAMISGIDTSRVSVEARAPHEAQRVAPAPHAESADTAKSAGPLVNPIISVDASGLVVVQYRQDNGEVRLQVPSESVVRAYRQRSPEADEPQQAPPRQAGEASPPVTTTRTPDQPAPAPVPAKAAAEPTVPPSPVVTSAVPAPAAQPAPPPARSGSVTVDA